MKKEFSLVDMKDGFIRGNIFNELHQPYKHYVGIKPIIRNEYDQDLVKLMAVSLYSHDLHLYLDVYPNDNKAFHLFKQYQNETNRLNKEFESKYGSMTVAGVGDAWDWVAFPERNDN